MYAVHFISLVKNVSEVSMANAPTSHDGNISVEMCSHEFFLKHALPEIAFVLGIITALMYGVCRMVWFGFPVLTRAYDNNGRRPRQKFVFGILRSFFKSSVAL